MKHAYLILAHNEFGLLQTLISCLDDGRNDIYVHIDAKVKDLPVLKTVRAGLKILDRRIDIRWGDLSMVEAEYALYEEAAASGEYAYYHLLSGVDLPLKSQDYIHDFFAAHAGNEFIGYTLTQMTPEISRRMQRWHIFPGHFSRRRNVYSAFRSVCLRFQELAGIRRNIGMDFKKGSQWASVTDAFVRYVLGKKDWALKSFSHTFVPDECFLQTLCWDSPFRDRLYDISSDGAGCMRAIGWRNDELLDWSASDFDTLKDSPALFARKFNSSDPVFINQIVSLSQIGSALSHSEQSE